ncbi:uncharacterized protein LOC135819551 [Sycon ciliatum]|uniref:uncharacterized protein LOC135819551 n=1 Tax=Sycon ciliatum TaxID=27933 RepID=UPI0020AD5E7A|eukprot:scpid47453/ scgid23323/ 
MAVRSVFTKLLSSKAITPLYTVLLVIFVTACVRQFLPRDPIDLSRYAHGFQFARLLAEPPISNDLAHLNKLVAGSTSSSNDDAPILAASDHRAHSVDPASGTRGEPAHSGISATPSSGDYAHPTLHPVTDTTPLLLPILPYGPNNQFRGFRDALVLAEWLNRTLVVPPFFKHHTAVTGGTEDTADVQDVFDWAQLANLQPMVHWEAWQELCNGTIEVMFQFKSFKLQSLHARIDRVLQIVGIHQAYDSMAAIHKPMRVTNSFKALLTPEEAQERFSSPQRCAAVLFPYKHVDISHNTVELALHLRRSKHLQKLAAVFASARMSVGPYAVLHWRYNNEWGGVWCHQPVSGPYDESHLTNPNFRSICRNVIALNVSHLPIVLNRLLKSRDIRHIYVATPVSEFSPVLLALRRDFPGLLTSRDLLAVVGEDTYLLKHAGLKPIASNFELSIVEQELASTAPTFIGSKQSTWSSNVVFERQGLFNRMRTFREPVIWINDLISSP